MAKTLRNLEVVTYANVFYTTHLQGHLLIRQYNISLPIATADCSSMEVGNLYRSANKIDSHLKKKDELNDWLLHISRP